MPFAPVTGGSSAGVLHAAGAQRGQLLASLLGSFLGQQQKDAEKVKADTQKANTLRKAISLYAPEMKDSVGAMGLADLEGVVGSFTMKQQAAATENAAADNRRADSFLKLQQDTFTAGQQQREAQGRLSQNLARYAAAPADLGSQFANGTAGLDTPGGLTLDRYLAAAGEAGAPPDPRVLEQFIQNGQRGGNAGLAFQEDPVTGARLATFGNSVIPTGTNPAKQTATAVDIMDSEGNVIGKGLPGRNGFQLIKAPAMGVDAKTRVSAILGQLKTESNLDRRKKLTEDLDALLNGGGQSMAPTAAGAVNDPLGLFN